MVSISEDGMLNFQNIFTKSVRKASVKKFHVLQTGDKNDDKFEREYNFDRE